MSAENKRDFLDPKALSRLMALPLNARQAMIGSVSGKHRSPIRGSSLEFAQYRKYVPGDDTRRLDWRTWGRSDRFYIKEFEADTNLRLCLIVDASGSMDFGDAGKTRLDLARRLGGTLAYLAAQQGDAVGIWGVGKDHRQKIPAKRGATHLGLALDQISGLEAKGETTILESLHEAAEEISQRALVVVISDFFVPPADLKMGLQHLRFRKHDIAMFHLLEQSELDFNFDRPARFLDMEGNEALLVDPSLIATRYREVVRSYLHEMDEVIRTTGADYHRVTLAEKPEDVLAKFLLGRVQKRGGRR
jgi:uncharacterized protein (DUF58 family)